MDTSLFHKCFSLQRPVFCHYYTCHLVISHVQSDSFLCVYSGHLEWHAGRSSPVAENHILVFLQWLYLKNFLVATDLTDQAMLSVRMKCENDYIVMVGPLWSTRNSTRKMMSRDSFFSQLYTSLSEVSPLECFSTVLTYYKGSTVFHEAIVPFL